MKRSRRTQIGQSSKSCETQTKLAKMINESAETMSMFESSYKRDQGKIKMDRHCPLNQSKRLCLYDAIVNI